MFQSKTYEHSFQQPSANERLQHAVSWLVGPEPITEKRPGHLLPRWIFLRALGLIYFSAFYSLLFQVKGLIGTDGLLPASDYLRAITSSVPGALRFWYAPTLLWINSSNHVLM